MREHAKFTQRKAEAFKAKEAQRHKQTCNGKGRAVALEVGDMI